MYLTDSHIHLQDYTPADIKNVVTAAQKNGVASFVCSSAVPDDWEKVLSLAHEYPCVIPSLGIHPWSAGRNDIPQLLAKLENLIRENPEIWIGECGIDRLKGPDTQTQISVFLPQAELALKYRRPLTVHAVKSCDIMSRYFKRLPPETLFHSFTGSPEWGREIQNRGFYLGINFSVLRKKNCDTLLHGLDINLLLPETDGPYQSGGKDKPSLPENLPLLIERIAAVHKISTEEMKAVLYRNWQNFKGETHYAKHP